MSARARVASAHVVSARVVSARVRLVSARVVSAHVVMYALFKSMVLGAFCGVQHLSVNLWAGARRMG